MRGTRDGVEHLQPCALLEKRSRSTAAPAPATRSRAQQFSWQSPRSELRTIGVGGWKSSGAGARVACVGRRGRAGSWYADAPRSSAPRSSMDGCGAIVDVPCAPSDAGATAELSKRFRRFRNYVLEFWLNLVEFLPHSTSSLRMPPSPSSLCLKCRQSVRSYAILRLPAT